MQNKNCMTGIDINDHLQHWGVSICCKYFMGINLEKQTDIDHRLTRVLTEQRSGLMGGSPWSSQSCKDFPGFFLRIAEHFA